MGGRGGEKEREEKQREGDKQGLLWGQTPQGVCVYACVYVCVLGGHSGGVWGHGGRDQSFGASSAGNREDGLRMEGGCGGREMEGERKGCGQF